MTFREGYYSVKDKIQDILDNEEAGTILISAIQSLMNMKLGKNMMRMMGQKTMEEMAGMMGSQVGEKGKGAMAYLNQELQKIKKISDEK